MNKKKRNIKLGFLLIGLNNAFFWYAPWLLFVYKYINIEQATLLQVIGLVTRVVAEIPTGAFADLLGKKKTLFLAFSLTFIGETAMAFSTDFYQFAIVYVAIGLGYSFYSGTIDAFMYDNLVEHKATEDYPSLLSRTSAITSISTAIATLAGGFFFSIWGGLPFLLTGLAKLVGVFVTFFLIEPKVDTFTFSTRNFLRQTIKGLEHLFNKRAIKYTLLLILLGGFATIAYEILDDVAVVDWGYSATGISVLYTAVIIFSIPSGFLYDRIAQKFKPSLLIAGGILILVLNYLFSPFINIGIWTFIFLLRVIYSPLEKAAMLDIINKSVESNIRATTLSTYELLIKVPFVVFGAQIGMAMNNWGIRNFSVIFSGVLLALFTIFVIFSLILGYNKRTPNT